MTFVAPDYTPAGMGPAGAASKDQRVLPPAASQSPSSAFRPTWSHMPDPLAPPECGSLKKDGSRCKARPHADGLCLGHARVAKKKA